jgi:hypothetical protein
MGTENIFQLPMHTFDGSISLGMISRHLEMGDMKKGSHFCPEGWHELHATILPNVRGHTVPENPEVGKG